MLEETPWRLRPQGQVATRQGAAQASGAKKGRKAQAGIVEVKCLGVCPRGAVTVVNGAASHEWLLVREGTEMAEVAQALGLDA